MRSESARARGAAAVAFGAALALYGLTASFTPVWPTTEPASITGVWLTDAIARLPLGDQVARTTSVAVVMGASSAALMAWIIARLRYGGAIAVGSALAAAFAPAVWRQAIGDTPGSVAGLLLAYAVAIVFFHPARRLKVAICALILLTAAALEPGIVLAGTPVSSSLSGWAAVVLLVREEWLPPPTVLIACGIVAPLCGAARAPTIAIVGTAFAVLVSAVGHDAAALAVFPAILLAHGLHTLPAVSPRARYAIALGLALLAAIDRWQAPDPQAWRVLAWRDAVERALPAGSTIRTSSRAAVALNGSLFAGRPSRIQIVYEPRGSLDNGAASPFVLDDLRAPIEATGGRLDPVSLTYNSPADMVSRLPPGTIVGLGISAAAAAAAPQHVAEALRVLGRSSGGGRAKPLATVGVVRRSTGSRRGLRRVLFFLPDLPDLPVINLPDLPDLPVINLPDLPDLPVNTRHVLMGDLIEGSNQRSPADFEVRASVTDVSARFEGSMLGAGTGWAAIAIDPRGPFIDAFASDVGGRSWAVNMPGLAVWQVPESSSVTTTRSVPP